MKEYRFFCKEIPFFSSGRVTSDLAKGRLGAQVRDNAKIAVAPKLAVGSSLLARSSHFNNISSITLTNVSRGLAPTKYCNSPLFVIKK